MVFNATFNNSSVISWQSVLSVGETGGSGENHLPVASHWQTLSIMVYTSPCSRFELTTSVVICTDCLGSSKSNYHTITARTAPFYSCILNNHDNNLTLIFLVWSSENLCNLVLINYLFAIFHSWIKCIRNNDTAIILAWFGLWYLTPLSVIFELYRRGQFYWSFRKKPPTCRKSLTFWILQVWQVTRVSMHFTILNCQQTRKRIRTDLKFTLIRRGNELHSKKYCVMFCNEDRTGRW